MKNVLRIELIDDIDHNKLGSSLYEALKYCNIKTNINNPSLYTDIILNIKLPIMINYSNDMLMEFYIKQNLLYLLYDHDYIDMHSIIYVLDIVSDYYFYDKTSKEKPIINYINNNRLINIRLMYHIVTSIIINNIYYNIKPYEYDVSNFKNVYDLIDFLSIKYEGIYVMINSRRKYNVPNNYIGNYTEIILIKSGENSRNIVFKRKPVRLCHGVFPVLNNRYNYKNPKIIKRMYDIPSIMYFEPENPIFYTYIKIDW